MPLLAEVDTVFDSRHGQPHEGGRRGAVFFLSPISGDGGGLTVVAGSLLKFCSGKKMQRPVVCRRDPEMGSRCPPGKSTPPGGFRRMSASHLTSGSGSKLNYPIALGHL